jgi:hypothetical protein
MLVDVGKGFPGLCVGSYSPLFILSDQRAAEPALLDLAGGASAPGMNLNNWSAVLNRITLVITAGQ